MKKAEKPVPRWRRWRERVAKFIHFGAFALFLFVLEILVVGGVRLDVGGMSLATIHVKNPLLYALALTLVGKGVAPGIALSDTITGRAWKWLRGHAQGIKAPRSAAIVGAVVIVSGYGIWRELTEWHHTTLAAKYESEGRNDLAAEHYAKAEVGFLNPQARPYREKRGYCLWRSGQFEQCASELGAGFDSGRFMGRAGYRALWSCYRELGRYEEAVSVVQAAMGTHSDLGRECSGVLAQLERKMAGVATKRVAVTFRVERDAGERPVHLAGNWASSGKQSEVRGYEPIEMVRTSPGAWEAKVELAPPGEFPYVAVATTAPGDPEAAALAMGQFRIDPVDPQPTTVELVNEPERGWVSKVAPRSKNADGKRRVVALWPDAGSWFLLNAFVHRGLMPNAGALLSRGARGEMISTNPPFTSTAYLRMIELQPAATNGSDGRVVDTLMIQLKGIPFLDGLFPDGVVQGGGPTVFSVLAGHGLTAMNLVFNDRFMAAPNDLTATDGTMINLDERALADSKEKRDVDGDTTRWILEDVLKVDREKERERARAIENEDVFLLGVENTEHKARAGLAIWREKKPDFMLLRFPSVDILSHKYFWEVEASPGRNLMIETYRHLDRILGEFVASLDGDDTLILVSDHGISGTLHHHHSCVLVVDGPGVTPGSSFDTIPIGHLPAVILSRFGIEEGADRLTDDSYAFFYGHPRSIRTGRAATVEAGRTDTL